LPKVVLAVRQLGLLLGPRQRWKQHRRQDCDYRDDNQQFDQSECGIYIDGPSPARVGTIDPPAIALITIASGRFTAFMAARHHGRPFD
jgi:hypothetical protein